jgi:Bacterial pullanase-associated domain
MIVATIGASLHDALSWLERWVAAATVVDWILLAVGAVAIVVAWRALNAPVCLGPIEVSAGEGDVKDGDFGRNEIATMRRELAQWGVVPAGGVPAGSPTANIATAIEASPIEYGKFVGALVKLIPVPPGNISFKVTASLHKAEAGEDKELTYQLVRSDTSETLDLDCVRDASPEHAIVKASGRIFRKIASSAPAIFPAWAEWPDDDAMSCYRTALKHEDDGEWKEATDWFAKAAAAAPDNMLARLRIANCLERRAGNATGREAALVRIWALNAYRMISAREPHIFEARYRASILLSVLADMVSEAEPAGLDGSTLQALRSLTGASADSAVETGLRGMAREEARAARLELHPLITLLRERRMRNRLEPRGVERRRVRRALRISRLALLVRRQWSPGEPVPWGGELKRLWWRIQVRCHFVLRNAGWQAHYNAACFYALLPEVAAPLKFPPQERPFLRERAIKHLQSALRDPRREITCEYVRSGDPDLRSLRGHPEWTRTMLAFCQREALLRYRRADGEYGGWGIYVWGPGVDPSALRTWPGSVPWTENNDGLVTFRVPLRELSSPVGVIVHAGGVKDVQEDREFRPLEHPACAFWMYDDDKDIRLVERPS